MANFFVGFCHGLHETKWFKRDVWLIVQPWGELVVAKTGGQILHYQPRNHQPVFWVNSPQQVVYAASVLKKDQAHILPVAADEDVTLTSAERGGVPLCWPWFAAHQKDPSLPNHGYARNATWQLDKALLFADGENQTLLSLSPCERLSQNFDVELTIEVRSNFLQIKLTTKNISRQPQSLTQALHSYFRVSNSEEITILGLLNSQYFDKLDANKVKQQMTQLRQIKAIDSIYQHRGEVVIEDPGFARKIYIGKENSASTVIWNPAAQARAIAIKQPKHFICVEAANTAYEALVLAPGSSTCLSQSIKIEKT